MSSYHHYYHFPSQGEILVSPANFSYGHDDGTRSKSPLSMINNPSLSPGPLSTPSHSRDNSQPPEQPPDQIMYDDVGGSQSDSPTSIRTPDIEAFDLEMQYSEEDIRNFYYQQNGAMPSTEIQQSNIPAMASNLYFNDEVLRDPYNASMTSQNQQHLQAPMSLQTQSFQNIPVSQSYNTFYSQNYTNQPPHQDPWTSQRPPQNPNVPRSGGVIFDPESDATMDYSNYVNVEVNNWTNNNTDPHYLVSPNEPLPPPQENTFSFPTQTQPQQVPLTSRFTALPRVVVPTQSQVYMSQNQSSSFLNRVPMTEHQISPPSPNVSTAWSSVGQLPSPNQLAISPQVSIPSPCGSEVIVPSYPPSEPGTTATMQREHSGADLVLLQRTPDYKDPSPTTSVSDVTFDTSPEPDARPRRTTSGRGSGRPGGRALGTHLKPKVAKAAHDMRKIVACWHCVLQRDKCGPGDTCERCLKRAQRPNADCGLGCSRVKLIELTYEFLPTIVTQLHNDSHLTHFANQHIQQWNNVEITIYMTCGQNHMPRIPVKVYEFIPKDNELLVQIQYTTDPVTHQRVPVKKESPALGMVIINQNEEKKYDKYISDIVDHHLDAFGELCWMEDDNDFQQKLFRLLTRVQTKSDEEAKLVREVFRLIVVTFVMSHVLTIAEETKHNTLSKMRSYRGPASYVQNFTSPRMANRQLKHYFCRIQRKTLEAVLNKLQQIFKSSKGCDKWLAAFVAVIGLCMAQEDQQKTIHLVMETKARTEGLDIRDAQGQADIACRDIDFRMNFIFALFRWKYNRKCNPLRDADRAWDKEVGFGDETSVNFVRRVAQLVKENTDLLSSRQSVSISTLNQTKYTSRLVGQFLLSFWFPQ